MGIVGIETTIREVVRLVDRRNYNVVSDQRAVFTSDRFAFPLVRALSASFSILPTSNLCNITQTIPIACCLNPSCAYTLFDKSPP